MKHYLLPLLAVLFFSTNLFAQPGALDITFNTDGKVVTDILSTEHDMATGVVVQPDGKTVVCGWAINDTTSTDFAVVRYNVDGTLDNTFGTGGIVDTDIRGTTDASFGIALQADGKIVMAGWAADSIGATDFAVVRYNTNGTLDATFNGDGIVITDYNGVGNEGTCITVQADGKILVGGITAFGNNVDFMFVRYNTNGTLDTSFDSDGIVITDVTIGDLDYLYAITLQPDGKIIATGSTGTGAGDVALIRLNTDGTLDNSFDGDGKVVTNVSANNGDQPVSVKIQPDSKIIVGAMTSNGTNLDFTLLRYKGDGTLDNTFGTGGIVFTDINTTDNYMGAILLQPDGKILAGGETVYSSQNIGDFTLVRYKANGVLDSTFAADGIVITNFTEGTRSGISSLAFAPDGKIVAGGTVIINQKNAFAAARYISGIIPVGIVDFAVKENTIIYPNPLADITTLEYTLTSTKNITLNLLDNQGKLVKTFVENVNQPAGNYKQELIMPNLASGIYYLNISSPNGMVSIRVVK